MRNITDVIDDILKIAPDLADAFRSFKTSLLYHAPEQAVEDWNVAAAILNMEASNHPKRDQIAAIFGGVDRSSA